MGSLINWEAALNKKKTILHKYSGKSQKTNWQYWDLFIMHLRVVILKFVETIQYCDSKNVAEH